MKNRSITIILLVLVSSPLHSMARFKKYANKESVKRFFRRATSDAHLLISTAPFVYQSYAGLKDYAKRDENIKSWTEASPEVQVFVREELTRQGMKNASAIKITQNTLNTAYASWYDKVLLVGTTGSNKYFNDYITHDVLAEALRDREHANPDTELILNTARFLIGHEKSHLQNHDHLKRIIALGVTPFATHGAFKILSIGKQPLMKLFGRTAHDDPYAVGESLLKIPTGYLKFKLNEFGIPLVSKYQEWRADEQVINNPDVLKAGRALYSALDASERNNLNPAQLKEKQSKDVHLGNHVCAQRLEKRLSKLQVVGSNAEK